MTILPARAPGWTAWLLLSLCMAPAIAADAPGAADLQAADIDVPRERLPAPTFTLKTLDGTRVRLADFRGRPLLMVHFWATFCKPCRKELPALDRLARDLGGNGLTVLAVAVDRGNPRVVGRFVRDHAIGLTVPLDPGGEVRTAYEIDALPTTYLIGPDGRFVGRAIGPRAWDSPRLRNAVIELTKEWHR